MSGAGAYEPTSHEHKHLYNNDFDSKVLKPCSYGNGTGVRVNPRDGIRYTQHEPFFSRAVNAKGINLLVDLSRVHQNDHPVVQNLFVPHAGFFPRA